MSHFYRLQTINTTSDSAALGWRNFFRPTGNYSGFEQIHTSLEDISPNPPWPHCKLMLAPIFPQDVMETYHIFRYKGTRPLPDIWAGGPITLVSQTVKDVIEAYDDFGHQFHQVPVWTTKKTPIETAVPYYQMHMRRFVDIESLGG